MKKYILFVVLTWVGMTLYAVDQIRQGNIIDGHVVVKGTEENVPLCNRTGSGTTGKRSSSQ